MASIIKRIVARYEADVSSFQAGIADAARKHDAFAKKVVDDSKKVSAANDATGRSTTLMGQKFAALGPTASRHMNEVVAATSRMKLAVAGAAGIVSGLLATSFVALGDQAKQVDNQLRGIGAASDEARAKVYALAIETRTPLEATIGLLRSMQKSLSTQSLDQTLRQVGTLNRLLTIGGLDAGQRGSVALQFGQALQSGILQGDELRALRESAPFELMDAIAKRAGGSVESLKDLGTQGKLTRDVMVGALEDLESVSKEKFGDFQMTVKDAMTVFNTSLVGAVGEIDNAVGATDALADALAGFATFLRDHSSALATMASALSTVAQVALLAAGTRGLMALAGSIGATTAGITSLMTVLGSMTNAAIVAAAAQQALMRGLGGVVALLGGPWGTALFAAGLAVTVLTRLINNFDENVRDAAEAVKSFDETSGAIAKIQEEMTSDGTKLEEVNKRIKDAIASQATEAEATAVRDKAAIEGRIAKNRELLEVQQELGRQTLLGARENVDDAVGQLANQSRSRTGWSMDPVQFVSDRQQIENERDRLVAKTRAGEGWTPVEAEWFADYEKVVALLEDVRKKELAHAEQAPGMANAHVRAWATRRTAAEAAAKAETDAIEKLNKVSIERAAKLAELEKQRASAVARLAAAPRGQERVDAASAIASADRQIAELRNVEERVAAARDTVDQMREAMGRAGLAFDPDGRLRGIISDIESRLYEAEKAGKTLDELRLNNLEGAIAAATVAAKNLGIELSSAANTNFDRLRAQMAAGPAPYSVEVNLSADAKDMVEFLKKKEGFISVPKYDENALRVGYGTDKVYDDQGRPQTVTASTRVTEEQASYALMRRLQEDFLPAVISAIGQSRWDALAPQQKTALASLSYNYGAGSFEKGGRMDNAGVIDAVKSGSNQAVANAIASLAGDAPFRKEDGTPVNRDRRLEEAAMWGDIPEGVTAGIRESDERAQKERTEAEQRAKRQQDYLASLTDENELLALKAELNGKSSIEQDYQIRVHQKLREATAAGMELDAQYLDTQLTLRQALVAQVEAEMQAEAQLAATRETERMAQEEADKRRQASLDRLNEKIAHRAEIEKDIQATVVGQIMHSNNLRESISQIVLKLAEARLYAGLFNTGPMAKEGGGSGLIGGFTKWLTGIFTSANGNVMTEYGPLPLQRYALGGIARSPQLSIFGEGRTPEAYVPLPDGRSIPVTIKTPDVPSFAAGAGGGLVRVVVDLNNELFQERIVETSGPVAAAVSRENLDGFSRNGLPSRMRQINSDPKRVR